MSNLGQEYLQARRIELGKKQNGSNGKGNIAQFAPKVTQKTRVVTGMRKEPNTKPKITKPTAVYTKTKMEDFDFRHLGKEDAATLKANIAKAMPFMQKKTERVGILLAGNIGTGKTTIAENILERGYTTRRYIIEDGDLDYAWHKNQMSLRKFNEAAQLDEEEAQELQALLEEQEQLTRDMAETQPYQDLLNGRMYSGTDVLAILDGDNVDRHTGEYQALTSSFSGHQVIVIDDADQTTIRFFPGEVAQQPERHRRWGIILDWFYRAAERGETTKLVITAMKNPSNQEMIEEFGEKAYSRMRQMLVIANFTGLPDYREVLEANLS